MTPTKTTLATFRQPVTVWPGHRAFEEARRLNREGLVSMRPIGDGQARVEITDKGREVLDR